MTALLRHRRLRTADRGAVTVEFALVVPLALLVIGFIMALGLRSLFAAATEYAARDLARDGSIRVTAQTAVAEGPCAAPAGRYLSEDELECRLQNVRLGALLQNATVTRTTFPEAPAQLGEGDFLTVVVTAPVPGVGALQSLAEPIGLDFLTEVTQRVTVRFE